MTIDQGGSVSGTHHSGPPTNCDWDQPKSWQSGNDDHEHGPHVPLVYLGHGGEKEIDPWSDPGDHSHRSFDPWSPRTEEKLFDDKSDKWKFDARTPVTIAAHHGALWFENEHGDHPKFIGADGLHTVIAAKGHDGPTTYFGYGDSVTASAGNQSLRGGLEKGEDFKKFGHETSSISGSLQHPGQGSDWVDELYAHETHHEGASFEHDHPLDVHGSSKWTLNDGTKVTFFDAHPNKTGQNIF